MRPLLQLIPVIHISMNDGLPKFICSDCETKVKKIDDFCNMIFDVQKRLEDEKKVFEDVPQKSKTDSDVDKPLIQQKICNVGSAATVSVGPDGKVECMLCQSYLDVIEHTTLHMVTHGIGTVICCCRVCGRQGELVQFLRDTSGRDDKTSVWCEKCQFVPPPKHKARIVHACEMCLKIFRSRAHLARHQMVHSGAKPFLCEVCGAGFSQKSSLKLHVLSHAGLNPHKCDRCGQSFRFKTSLRSHVMSVHWPTGASDLATENSRYKCDRCSKQFATAHKLQRHYRAHTGERPYECTQCGRLFSQTGNFNLHRKRHEEDRLPDDSKQITANLKNTVVTKSHLLDNRLGKAAAAAEQFTVPLLAQEPPETSSTSAQYISEPDEVLQSTHDAKFLETILQQHPVVTCANLDDAESPLSSINTVLLHSAEKAAQFASLPPELVANSSHITPPRFLSIEGSEHDKSMQQKASNELFPHFSDEGLLYMNQPSSIQDSASVSEGVVLPTFSSLQTGPSISNISHHK